MNAKILKKLSKKVSFRQNNRDGVIEYVVERKSEDTGEWDVIGRSLRFERALMKKHNAWHAELSRMNYTNELLYRRKHGKFKLFKKKKRK